MPSDNIGHNSKGATITVERRLFNSLTKFSGTDGPFANLTLPAGSTINDVARVCGIPVNEIYLAMRNGRDVTGGLVGDPINGGFVLEDGEVVALSGPVPYSYGYGAPVV